MSRSILNFGYALTHHMRFPLYVIRSDDYHSKIKQWNCNQQTAIDN